MAGQTSPGRKQPTISFANSNYSRPVQDSQEYVGEDGDGSDLVNRSRLRLKQRHAINLLSGFTEVEKAASPRIKKLGILKKSNNSQIANQCQDSNRTGGSNEHIVLNSLFSSNLATTHQNTHRVKKVVMMETLEPQLHTPHAQEHIRI